MLKLGSLLDRREKQPAAVAEAEARLARHLDAARRLRAKAAGAKVRLDEALRGIGRIHEGEVRPAELEALWAEIAAALADVEVGMRIERVLLATQPPLQDALTKARSAAKALAASR